MISIHVLKASGLTDEQIVRVLQTDESERILRRREQNRINKQNQRSRQHVSADLMTSKIPQQNQRSCHQAGADEGVSSLVSKKVRKKEDTPTYAFESGIIQLNQKDFDRWESAFSCLSLSAELIALTEWANAQGKRWFFAVSAALAKRNREVKARVEAEAKRPAFRWNGIEGVI
jgi:hypothetical protein